MPRLVDRGQKRKHFAPSGAPTNVDIVVGILVLCVAAGLALQGTAMTIAGGLVLLAPGLALRRWSAARVSEWASCRALITSIGCSLAIVVVCGAIISATGLRLSAYLMVQALQCASLLPALQARLRGGGPRQRAYVILPAAAAISALVAAIVHRRPIQLGLGLLAAVSFLALVGNGLPGASHGLNVLRQRRSDAAYIRKAAGVALISIGVLATVALTTAASLVAYRAEQGGLPPVSPSISASASLAANDHDVLQEVTVTAGSARLTGLLVSYVDGAPAARATVAQRADATRTYRLETTLPTSLTCRALTISDTFGRPSDLPPPALVLHLPHPRHCAAPFSLSPKQRPS